MIIKAIKKKRYLINTATGLKKTWSGWQNFSEFDDLRAAMRYFKANPLRDQIDIRGVEKSRCLYYKVGRDIYQNKESRKQRSEIPRKLRHLRNR